MHLSDTSKQNLDGILARYTKGRKGIPGMVYAAIDKNGDMFYESASGVKSVSTPNAKMTADTVFVIASFTKLITTISLLQLVEKGKVSLDDPKDIEKWLPEAANAQLIDGKVGSFTFRKPKEKVTLRMLLDHSGGFSYTFFNSTVRSHYDEKDFEGELDGSDTIYKEPILVSEPGKGWHYGIGLDLAGMLLERIEKTTLGDYMKANIFTPLGLKDIRIPKNYEDAQSANRLAGLHQRTANGRLFARDHLGITTNPRCHSGGAGLISTAADYLKILSCLVNDGKSSNGHQLLKKETVDQMFKNSLQGKATDFLEDSIEAAEPDLTNPIPNLQPNCKKAWGLSWLITEDELPTGRKANSAWWAGITNCFYTADRETGIATVILSQILPFADGAVMTAWGECEAELYKGLQK